MGIHLQVCYIRMTTLLANISQIEVLNSELPVYNPVSDSHIEFKGVIGSFYEQK